MHFGKPDPYWVHPLFGSNPGAGVVDIGEIATMAFHFGEGVTKPFRPGFLPAMAPQIKAGFNIGVFQAVFPGVPGRPISIAVLTPPDFDSNPATPGRYVNDALNAANYWNLAFRQFTAPAGFGFVNGFSFAVTRDPAGCTAGSLVNSIPASCPGFDIVVQWPSPGTVGGGPGLLGITCGLTSPDDPHCAVPGIYVSYCEDSGTSGNCTPFNDTHIGNIVAHELGHALSIGHTSATMQGVPPKGTLGVNGWGTPVDLMLTDDPLGLCGVPPAVNCPSRYITTLDVGGVAFAYWFPSRFGYVILAVPPWLGYAGLVLLSGL